MSNTKYSYAQRCGNCAHFMHRSMTGRGCCEIRHNALRFEMDGTKCSAWQSIEELPTTKKMK